VELRGSSCKTEHEKNQKICYNKQKSSQSLFGSYRNTKYDSTYTNANIADHRVHTEWQLPISGVHSIMIEKSALAGEGGGCTPAPFNSESIATLPPFGPIEGHNRFFQISSQ
jgi:hypothetical protein